MHRLFVALRPSPPVRALLLGAMGGVPGARWQDDLQLHLTLAFVGAVDPRRADEVATGLDAVDGPSPTVAIRGAGTFDAKGRIHTLWAGVAPDPALSLLQQRVVRAIERTGVTLERRAFTPHVTLARFGRASAPAAIDLERFAALASTPERIDHMILYESLLGADGAHYAAVARYPLTR